MAPRSTHFFMANTQTLINQAYSAFNQRDIDSALALMSENVSWPKAPEGGRVVGKKEIRAYWTQLRHFCSHPGSFWDHAASRHE
jgi:ketosteroid isomerase-like protein